jgi:hypothetical protein
VVMGSASTSETSVYCYRTTWRNNPEDRCRDSCLRKNVKSHLFGNWTSDRFLGSRFCASRYSIVLTRRVTHTEGKELRPCECGRIWSWPAFRLVTLVSHMRICYLVKQHLFFRTVGNPLPSYTVQRSVHAVIQTQIVVHPVLASLCTTSLRCVWRSFTVCDFERLFNW